MNEIMKLLSDLDAYVRSSEILSKYGDEQDFATNICRRVNEYSWSHMYKMQSTVERELIAVTQIVPNLIKSARFFYSYGHRHFFTGLGYFSSASTVTIIFIKQTGDKDE